MNINLLTVPGPIWTNRCSHAGYVASYEVAEYAIEALAKPGTPYRFDLYVWDNHWGEHEVCIRFGNDDPDYYSPGKIPNVYLFAKLDRAYARAVEVLQAMGDLFWRKKPRFPYWRRTRYTDDGCELYQCLDCKAEWESRTIPDKFCPHCGVAFRGNVVSREQGEPRWQYEMQEAGKNTSGLNPHSKRPFSVLGIEIRSVTLAGDVRVGWHLKYVSDHRFPHTAKTILEYVRRCRIQEEQRIAGRFAENEEDLAEYDAETRENIRRMSREWTRDEFRVVSVRCPLKTNYSVTTLYNRG